MAAEENLIAQLVEGIIDTYVCPITHERMSDPVVAADGYTYERTAIEKWFVNNKTSPIMGTDLKTTALFPNGAFKDLISDLATLKEEQDITKFVKRIYGCVCPITKKPMQDPVIAAGGVTYERTAIEKWWFPTAEKNITLLFPNRAFKELVLSLTDCVKGIASGESEKQRLDSGIAVSDSIAIAEAVRLEAEDKRKKLEADKRFERSDEPGMLYKAHHFLEFTDADLLAYGINPLQCVRWKKRWFGGYNIDIYDSIETQLEVENKRKELEADTRFEQSVMSFALYEGHDSSEFLDADLTALGIKLSCCIRRNIGADYYISIYASEKDARYSSQLYKGGINEFKAFKRSDKPGAMYEISDSWKILKTDLIALGIDPLCCIEDKVGEQYHITVYDSRETAEAARQSLAAEAEDKRKKLDADIRFERSDKPGVLYEGHDSSKFLDADLIALGFEPLCCVQKNVGTNYHIIVYASVEKAGAAQQSLASNPYQFYAPPPFFIGTCSHVESMPPFPWVYLP